MVLTNSVADDASKHYRQRVTTAIEDHNRVHHLQRLSATLLDPTASQDLQPVDK